MTRTGLHKHPGGCHCGNIRVVAELTTTAPETTVRACPCTFCRAHGARTASDPQGSLKVWAQDWTLVTRYRNGTQTADFLICQKCGVFVAAVIAGEAGPMGVVNVNALTDQHLFTKAPVSLDIGKEDGEDAVAYRLRRRAATWMPAILHT